MNHNEKTLIRAFLLGLLLLVGTAAARAQYTYTTNSDGISLTITGYNGPGGNVSIPSNISGLTVAVVGPYSFSNHTNVTGVTIPGSVTSIEDGAFDFCRSITNISIPSSVTNIGEYAFEACTGLDNITVGSGVTTVGLRAFAFSGMTNAIISVSATNLEGEIFFSCALTSVTVTGDFDAGQFANDFEGCVGLTNVIIEDGVMSLTNGMFEEYYQLETVTMPNSLTSIGEEAFQACYQITNMTIPAGVTNIGAQAFYGCDSLRGIFFAGNAPNGNPSMISSVSQATAYFLPGTTGWSNTLDGQIPAVLWNPVVQPGSFGVSNNQFGFNITGTPNIPVVVDACTNLSNPLWTPLQQFTLTNGLAYFCDPQWTNYPGRYYRIRSPH